MNTPSTQQQQRFDYNVDNYSLAELKDIFGITNADSIYISNEKMSDFFASSAHNPAMLRFFRAAQSKIFQSQQYNNELVTDEYDDNEYDDEYYENDDEHTPNNTRQQSESNKSDTERSNMLLPGNSMEKYYPPDLVVNNHSANMGQPLDALAGGDGEINPLFRNTYRCEVCVDSVFKKSTENASSFTVFFPKHIDKIISMRMKAIELPNSIYNITAVGNRNQMYITTRNLTNIPASAAAAGTTSTITVPPGEYTLQTLSTTINNIMSNSTTGMQYLVFSINPTTKLSMIRAKMSADPGQPFYPYSTENNSTYSPNFEYTVSFPTYTAKADLKSCDTSPTAGTAQEIFKDGLGWTLGFRKASYNVTVADTFNDIISLPDTILLYKACLQSEAMYNDKLNDYVFVDVNDFNNSHVSDGIISNTLIGYLGNTLFARIPLSTASNLGLRTYMTDFEPRRDYFGPVKIDRLHMRLLNKYGDLIDLGGQDYSAIFEFMVRYA